MQWLALRKYGMVVVVSRSASSVPVQTKLEPPDEYTIRATALICGRHWSMSQVASRLQEAAALATMKSVRVDAARCETIGIAMRNSLGREPLGSSISTTIVSSSITGDQ